VTPARRLLIVNADDLGRTRGINGGVFEAHRRGIVTSATAMVNYPAVREAAAMSRDHPGLGIGLHVALTGGATTLPAAQVASLVDASGRLPAKPEGHGSPLPAELLAEIEAQYARFVDIFGRRPTHFDSHHHSHRRPDVYAALTALASREGIPVRNAGGMKDDLRARGLKTTDAFDETFFDDGVSAAHLVEIVRGLRTGSTELMCHPAHEDAELAATSSYAAVRVRELAALTDPAVREAVDAASVELVSFAAL
jgi:hypothetical protein